MNNDLISRQAVFDVLRMMFDTHIVETEGGDEYIDYNDTVYEIEQLPSVNPQSKTGHWIDAMPLTPWLEYRAECSECHCFGMRSDKYCRSCGAKMVETQERNE